MRSFGEVRRCSDLSPLYSLVLYYSKGLEATTCCATSGKVHLPPDQNLLILIYHNNNGGEAWIRRVLIPYSSSDTNQARRRRLHPLSCNYSRLSSGEYLSLVLSLPFALVNSMLILLLCLLCSVCSSLQMPKCLAKAPYHLNQLAHQLAIDKVVREAQGRYEARLAWMGENINLLPPSQQQAALDYFMEVYCPSPYFDGFIGITGDEHLFTNRTEVAGLYLGNFLGLGPGVTFNVKFYNEDIVIDQSLSSRQVVYANITAFNEHIITGLVDPSPGKVSVVNGYYINQWRIDSQGNPCLSRFHDVFLKVFVFDSTTYLNLPMNLKI